MTQHLTTETLIDYLRGELEPAEDALAHTHLQECGVCRAEHERETRLSEMLAAAAQREELDLPGMVRARIWEAVRAAQPSPYARMLGFLRPAIAVPAAAVLVVATYFASPLGHRGPTPPMIDATYYLEQHAAQQLQNPLGERNVTSAVLETSDSAGPAPILGTATAAAAALNAVE
jgi:predicted anti-sigma-YlaC factor YlaD